MSIISKLSFKRVVLYSAVITIILLIVFLSRSCTVGKSIDNVSVPVLTKNELRELKRYPNKYHLQVGRANGIAEPFYSQAEMLEKKDYFVDKYNLVLIKDNRYYEIPKLIHSLPYLKKPAKIFMDNLGKRFNKRLKNMGLRKYKYSATSILRTLDDQKGLRKSNVNATPNASSHYYGLTFDIAQTRFFEVGNSTPVYSYRLRNILLRELIEMQKSGLCYVLLESQTKCIHITVL